MGVAEELRAEQAHVDRAYGRLDELRAGSTGIAGDVLDLGEGGTFGDRVDRDVKLAAALARRGAFSIGDQPLCFGRIDMLAGSDADADAGSGPIERLHIGRLGVSDRDGEPLVVDWRAPIAETFYRATSHDPMGLTTRRHLRMHGRTVVGIDDELLDGRGTSDAELVGEGALLAALGRARTGRMGDIVATIQGEQDRAIRAPRAGVLVVQGGPGTGKTAVALHRAAYLLYEHRFPLASQGVLVLGPNPVFLRYVENVLPGLGETGVRLATPAELVTGIEVTAIDPVDVGAVKAGLAMVDALAATIDGHQCPLDEPGVVPFGAHRLVVSVADSVRIVEETKAEGLLHHAGRPRVERQLLRVLWARLRTSLERAVRGGLIGPEAATPRQRETLRSLRRTDAFGELLDQLWPVLTAEQVVRETIADLALPNPEGWSAHDAALIDEATTMLGPLDLGARPKKKPKAGIDSALDRTLADMGLLPHCPECRGELTYAGNGDWLCERMGCDQLWPGERVLSDDVRNLVEALIANAGADFRAGGHGPAPTVTFGHVVVDEAQDLTPMQWRVLRRRNPTDSMTVVGDLGQAKYPWSPASWAEIDASEVIELSVNYRTPEEVMELAAPVLSRVNPALTPPRSVRRSEEPPVFVTAESDDTTALVARARRIAVDESAIVRPGTVAVILPDDLASPSAPAVLDDDIAELSIENAKGLEFDSVIVVDPDAFSPAALYVALTRTTRRLVIVQPAGRVWSRGND